MWQVRELFALADATTGLAKAGALDTGYTIASMGMQTPTVPLVRPAANRSIGATYERQRIVIVRVASARVSGASAVSGRRGRRGG